jgi:hypothetical protein
MKGRERQERRAGVMTEEEGEEEGEMDGWMDG